MIVRIQEEDFEQALEHKALATGPDTGAVVTFVGRVRSFTSGADEKLLLQHYPGMTEKILTDIVARAEQRWPIHQVRLVHRVGYLRPEDQIVFVGVSARHRKDAFAACEFIVDFLKTEAPFWKKEGDQWVAAKDSDAEAANEWYE